MTDSEIVKALECCLIKDCDNCPFDQFKCEPGLEKESLALINRQKAEIERLKTFCKNSQTATKYWHKTAKSKQAEIERLNALIICKNKIIEGLDKSIEYAYNRAIQEFAEKLKNKLTSCSKAIDGKSEYLICDFDIDNLVKEMAGE